MHMIFNNGRWVLIILKHLYQQEPLDFTTGILATEEEYMIEAEGPVTEAVVRHEHGGVQRALLRYHDGPHVRAPRPPLPPRQ